VSVSPTAPSAETATTRVTARALLLGERIDTAGLERSDVVATAPLTFRVGDGTVTLFRYGVAVLIGLSPLQEDEVARGLAARVVGPLAPVDEATTIEINGSKEDQIAPGGPISVRDLSAPRLLVIADALAKNVALARDEREVSRVFEVIEPFAAGLARTGKSPAGRRHMLRTIGQALLVHHRMTGRVEVEDKPDVLWDHPHLERLYARLADEYELKERADAISRKLEVISNTAQALIDITDTERSVRLEATIILLIVIEVVFSVYDLFFRVVK
jgi:uncharacterized Rmd1/YagE family protein